jgi:hypothetical protein
MTNAAKFGCRRQWRIQRSGASSFVPLVSLVVKQVFTTKDTKDTKEPRHD